MKAHAISLVTTIACLALSGCNGERSAWNEAQQANTSAAYEAYLKAFPDGKHGPTAKEALEDLAWKQAQEAGSEQAFLDFTARFSAGPRAEEAKGKAEAAAWAEAERQATEAAFQAFADGHPASGRRGEARVRAVSAAWAVAEGAGSEEAYQAFVGKYPYGPLAAAAEEKIRELQEKAWWSQLPERMLSIPCKGFQIFTGIQAPSGGYMSRLPNGAVIYPPGTTFRLGIAPVGCKGVKGSSATYRYSTMVGSWAVFVSPEKKGVLLKLLGGELVVPLPSVQQVAANDLHDALYAWMLMRLSESEVACLQASLQYDKWEPAVPVLYSLPVPGVSRLAENPRFQARKDVRALAADRKALLASLKKLGSVLPPGDAVPAAPTP